MLIHEFLEKSAARYPDKTAVIQGNRKAGFAQINGLANRLARWLRGKGVSSGGRVALICENGIEYIVSYYGILKSGAVAVALDPGIKPRGLSDLLGVLSPEAIIASAVSTAALQDLLKQEQIRLRANLVWDIGKSEPDDVLRGFPRDLWDESDENPGLAIDPNDCAAIVFTSGSAGKPKGVMLSHANIVANTRSIVSYLELGAADVQMVVLPFHYVMGKSLLNTHFAVGGSVVINNRFAYTAAVLKQMSEEGVTGFSGVPSTYAQLLFRSPLGAYRNKLSKLRYCSQAGGHMARHIKLELMKALPAHTRLVVMYGATEASARLTYVPPERLGRKIDSIGIPIPGVSMEILASDGRILGPGETGELVARGSNIMLGYFKDENATRQVLDVHGYHTGDLGYKDDEGYFYVTGRIDAQLKVGGHRLSPAEIEDVVIGSGHAADCIVFAVQDAIMGQKLAGLVVPVRAEPNVAMNILEHCHRRLPKYKVPSTLLVVKEIPKNSSGKPDRGKCAEIYERTAAKRE